MPQKLLSFLLQLNNEDADELWFWLDNTPQAVDEIVAELLSSHGALTGPPGGYAEYLREMRDANV